MVQALIRALGPTRRRLQLQRAVEAGATLGLGWAVAATVLVYLLRTGALDRRGFWLSQLCAAALLILLTLAAALRRISAHQVAKRVDVSHRLHDRLSTALEFCQAEAPTSFMRAQVADAVRHLAGVQARRAAPLRCPRHARPLGLLCICLTLVAALPFPVSTRPPPPPRPAQKLAVAPEDLEPQRLLARELQQEAAAQDQPELERLARELNRLFDQIERQELTRKELFAKLAELEKKHFQGMEGDFDDLLKRLKKMGDELQREKLTKDLAKSLQDADLQRAKKELEKLAQDQAKLKEKERAALAKSLERSAKERLDPSKAQQKSKELEQQIRRLQKQLRQQKNQDPETRRRLERNQRHLQRLNQEAQRAAEQQRQLQRLNQAMQQAAQDLAKHLSPEAMKALQQAAQQMQRFADQLTRQRMMSKAQGQMMDLKEFLRRLGQGRKGQQGKLQDFFVRAGGGKLGQGKEGKIGKDGQSGKNGKKGLLIEPGGSGEGGSLLLPAPGSSPGPGQDSAQGMPGNGVGTGTDPNVQGQATKLLGQRKESLVRGQESKGPSRSEVILGAADKGFASQSYRRVYRDYTQVIEEALKQEDVPLGYQYFVKRYFQLIKPR